MGREIKFRAWDGERLRIVGGLGWVDGELDSVLTPKYGGAVEDGVAIMQYTGLEDKNGAEIYEGDILHQDKYPTPDMKITFIDGCFVGVSTNRIQEINWEPTKIVKLQELEYRVIGNIYENPELLLND